MSECYLRSIDFLICLTCLIFALAGLVINHFGKHYSVHMQYIPEDLTDYEAANDEKMLGESTEQTEVEHVK